MFKKHTPSTPLTTTGRLSAFDYIDAKDIYLDAACQSLRPQPVIDALDDYYRTYNACGGRVKYAWGKKVDQAVHDVRSSVLDFLKLSDKSYTISFTLNTTYGINLLLQQLPASYKAIVTSEIEHNSVFLPTMVAAKRLGIPRLVLQRNIDGTLIYDKKDVAGAVVVVNSASNIDGRLLTNITDLIADTHSAGGIVIIDAAQTMAHEYALLQSTNADAICFSAHKMYGPSLGVVVVKNTLLQSLEHSIVGGGMVFGVKKDSYQLLPDDLSSHLEPGLQAYGEIIAFGAALDWLRTLKIDGATPKQHMYGLAERLYDGLVGNPRIHMIGNQARPVMSFSVDGIDAHRFAVFLSTGGIMARSGTFCCHYYLDEICKSPPLVRFSLGLHNTPADIDKTLQTVDSLTQKDR